MNSSFPLFLKIILLVISLVSSSKYSMLFSHLFFIDASLVSITIFIITSLNSSNIEEQG